MPMDYDDNDTSRHNLQLAGEGRSRSSTLRPYDFPKFDFDDSLQGHLRFDSLVETEVFLGIQSQEDNQWIEDFSRDSNGMEFNSTPADSCSISRRNNVWSEATSSESVEMLLKSVGQEEMMHGASILPESDATHDQGIPSKHGETGIKLNERNEADVVNSDTALQPGDVLEDSPASGRHMAGQLEDPSATHAKIESACGNSSNVNQNALCDNGRTSTNEGVHSFHDSCAGEKLKESQISVEKTIKSGAIGDSLSLVNEDNNVAPSIGILGTSKTPQQDKCNASHESCCNDGQESQVFSVAALEDTAILEEKAGVTSINICTGSNSPGLISESGRDCQEASHLFSRDPTNNSVKGESELKSSEGDDENTSTSNQTLRCEEVFSVSKEVNEPFDGHQGQSSMDLTLHPAELGSLHSGDCASTEQDMDVNVQLPHKKDNDNKENVSALPLNHESMSGMPLLSIDDNGVSIIKTDFIGKTDLGDSSNVAVLSYAADHKHTEDVEGCHSESVVTGEESAANVFSHGKDVSIQGIQEVHRQADFSQSEKDDCKTKEADKEVSTELGNIESENAGTAEFDQRTQSLEIGEGVESNNPIHNLQPQISGEPESAKTISPLATNSASTALDDCHEIGQRESSAVGLYHSENDREEAGTKESNDTNIGAEGDSTSKDEVRVADDSIGISFSEVAAKSLQPVDKIDDVCSIEHSSAEAMNCLDSGHPQAISDSNTKSSSKESPDAHLISDENHEKAMSKEEERESAPNLEFDKTSCGSPTIISSSEPSQTEKDNHEEGRSHTSDEVVKDIQSTSKDPKRKDLLVEDSSFTFKVNVLPDMTEKEPAKNWSPFPDVEKHKVVEETAPSGKGKTERTTLQKTPRHNARASDGESGPGGTRSTSERKGRRGSAKGTAKENSKKGNQLKGPIQENASMKADKVSNMLLSTPISSPLVQFGQMQAYGNIEGSSKKPSGVVDVPTSSLPDLNTSALNNTISPSASFRQSFTDMQQVQLRAQIFVYGSLIQGTAPDEACMISAFGPSDAGRNSWEPIWRVAVERVRNQKSSSSAAETPTRSQSGPRASDGVKQGSHSSKVLATPVSRGTNKDTPAAIVNPMIPLSSPLWNISTPTRDSLMSNAMNKGPVVDFQQSVTPVHSFQTPPLRNFVGHTSWPPQTCFPAPWMASPQTAAFSSSVRFHPVTMTETVKLTPVNDTSAVLTSSVKHTTSSPAVQNVSSSPLLGAVSPLQGPKIIASAEQHIVDSKPRKRKKAPASDPGQVSSVSEAQTEAVVISDVATFPCSSMGGPPPAFQASDAILSKFAVDASRVSSIDPPKNVDGDTGKAVSCSEETLNKVAEAKSQAENAADLAVAAISHCEDLWSQLAKKKESGLTSEAEVKLASAAVAIAAAASVAKAAAAAAKIACNAALQAKLMADEAFCSSKTSGMEVSNGKSTNDVQDIGNATPTSILKSNNVGSQSSSILLAAKEAAKKRVEAASAASRQAENLDAIVKAAELAAAAVSQAGKIVAMGEPLPLNDLIEAGPEGCWKSSQPSAVLAGKVRDGNAEWSGAVSLENDADMPASIPVEQSVEMGRSRIVGMDDMHSTERLNGSLNVCMSSSVGIIGSKHTDKVDFRSGINFNIPDTSKSGRVASEPDALHGTGNFKNEREVGTLAEEEFKEGSSVEVFKPGNGLKSAWYSANVLSLEDGKAYVCYNDLLSEEGSGNLREWVPLEGEGDNAPVIRAAHPSTALQYQQTRKRRRAALGDYAWCVGDRVDVWIDDCWWEGVVTEKNEKDETTLKVHIPAQGETSTVRAWNLRASLSWINGKWIEWSSSRGQNASELSDTPQEKRQKLEIQQSTTKVKDKESNNVDSAQGKYEQSKSFNFSTSERTFDIGKTTNDDSKRATRRPLRTNQQEVGSRGVVFGVPKPTGKKRKFMEVSKHFPANKSSKSSEVNDSVKFTKYLMPQGAASRGWKALSRNDSKEKRTAESKSRALSTRKAHRTLPLKENLRSTLTRDVENSMDHGTDVEDSAGHDNTSEKSIDHGSVACEDTSEAPLSSLLPHSLGAGSKKIPSLNTKSDRLNRGKLGPSGGKLSKIEEDRAYSANTDKSNLDGSEPRRSNRRIQPTHRLLEGLQSSMVIPKMPSVSHDKGRRNLPARGK